VVRPLKSVADACGATGVQIEEFGRRIADLLGRLALGFFPGAGAEFVQRRRVRCPARVAADHMQLRNRHIELVVAGIFKHQQFGAAFAQIHRNQTLIAANAVRFVHDRVANLEFRQIAQHRIGIAAFLLFAAASLCDGGIKVALGDNGKLVFGERKTADQGGGDEHEALGFGVEIRPGFGQRRLDAIFGKILRHRFAPAQTLGADQNATRMTDYEIL